MNDMSRSRRTCAIGMRTITRALTLLSCCAFLLPAAARAQGVTTASMTGLVKDASGGVIPGATVTAVHQPSGTSYEAVTGGDGRFTMPGMRVGGPYTVTAQLAGFTTEVQNNITLTLGVAQDLAFTLKVATVAETITVVGSSDPVFSTSHTGAATAVMREDLATLPTISGRITDITRLTPQYGGNGTFSGQDNRANNVTVDGSYFNNSFGLGVTTGGIGDRTGVAPISLEAIEQVQVNVAPYDVRQGNFTGAGVNTVTRSGTNNFTASGYFRTRNENCSDITVVDTCSGFVGTNAASNRVNPLNFTTRTGGLWAGGPIVKNKLFAFGAWEKQQDTRPLTTFTSNPGGAPVQGNTTRVLASDMSALSAFLSSKFGYDTGPFDNITKVTPATPWMVKADYNVNSGNKVTLRYNQLDSSSPIAQNGSGALGTLSRQTATTSFLGFQGSNYAILENLRSGIGEWNSVFGNMTNNLIAGYTKQDESRGPEGQTPLFPFVVISDGSGSPYTTFGSEPFTPYNLLKYGTFQLQDSVTKFARNHSITFGGNLEKFHSDNSFYFGIQSAYAYNTLADFYTDANGYLANPNRTVSPVTLLGFQVKYLLQPGQTTPPLQPLDVIYAGGYVQDEWRPRTNLTVTAGLRVDVPRFGNTAFDNPVADNLTFRGQDGSPVKYNTGALPETTAYWSPRVGFNWDATSDQMTQVRGGTGLFSGKPPYVWISNQIGNTGVLFGFIDSRNTTAYPFNPSPDKYKPAATGGTAASYELDVTDNGFRFPQTWRSNVGIDRKLPGGLVGTLDYIYNRDINAPVYINANLPAAEGNYTGVDNRPRWAATAPGTAPAPGITTALPACAANGQAGPCFQRLNNEVGNQITANYVIMNQSQNRSWNISGAVTKNMTRGFMFKGGFNYGVSQSLVEPSSTAASSWGSANPIVFDPNNPSLAYSTNSPGKRFFFATTYTHQWLNWGATTLSAFYDGHTNNNISYVFAGDANGDAVSGNDLIYIPRDQSEMNFKPLTVTSGGVTYSYTAAQQAAAFDQLIQSDDYLNSRRGQYAERNGVFLPVVHTVDLSITQDVFSNVGGKKHSGQVRLDITNFGNLLNKNWGVGQRLVNNQILTAPGADAQGRLTYNLQTLNGQLITNPLQTSAILQQFRSDVYVLMLSFRYTFQ
jgi:Carboxypeptidase regulatory-like domain